MSYTAGPEYLNEFTKVYVWVLTDHPILLNRVLFLAEMVVSVQFLSCMTFTLPSATIIILDKETATDNKNTLISLAKLSKHTGTWWVTTQEKKAALSHAAKPRGIVQVKFEDDERSKNILRFPLRPGYPQRTEL
ncbi:hypothetical protein Bca52824_019329 [Brassica carinata]|uniref:Uncharacterized protein n=1 Tax=Brassica carinata TaxID=52824 RepID=A0A8X8AZF9_BRACI|nr:hypothetical protein Bca52824_019329 [Brassica carinata]